MRDEEFGELKSDVKHIMDKTGSIETKLESISIKLNEVSERMIGQDIRLNSLESWRMLKENEKEENGGQIGGKKFTRTDLMWGTAIWLVSSVTTLLMQYVFKLIFS